MLFRSFLVDHICITCDRYDELKRGVFNHICCKPMYCFCEIDTKIDDSMTIISCLVDMLQPTKVILPMLDCSNLSRIKSDLSYILCFAQTFLSTSATDVNFTYICKLSCMSYTGHNDHVDITNRMCVHSSLVGLAYSKFDHRSSVRTLDLLLNKIDRKSVV